MSLNIDSRYITGIYALGQWFKVKANTIDVDAYEFCNWLDTDPDDHAWDEEATVYQMGAAYQASDPSVPSCGSFGDNSRKTWQNPSGYSGITFIDEETGERVSFSLLEVKAFRERRPTAVRAA